LGTYRRKSAEDLLRRGMWDEMSFPSHTQSSENGVTADVEKRRRSVLGREAEKASHCGGRCVTVIGRADNYLSQEGKTSSFRNLEGELSNVIQN